MFFYVPISGGGTLDEVEGLCAAIAEPLVFLTPTDRFCSPKVRAALRRHGAIHVAMDGVLVLDEAGELNLSEPGRATLAAVLGDFERALNGRLDALGGCCPKIASARQAPCELPLPERSRYRFHNVGSSWRVVFEGGPEFHIPDGLGAKYLNYLFQHPNEAISAYDLEVAISPQKAEARPKESIRNGLDPQTVREYLREIDKLRAKREEASEDGNVAEADRLDEEISAFESAIRQPGLGADAGEKARGNVRKSISALRQRLLKGETPEKAFGEHIAEHVSLGYELIYSQPLGRIWR